VGRKACWKKIEFGELLILKDFINCCKSGALIDSDGWGEYATATMVSNIRVKPSDYNSGKLKMQHTHVLWYNR